jgi:hypothetical protein
MEAPTGSESVGASRTRRGDGEDRYWSSTRVPLIVWVLSVLRKLGIKRSMSSKYDDRAGDVWLAL